MHIHCADCTVTVPKPVHMQKFEQFYFSIMSFLFYKCLTGFTHILIIFNHNQHVHTQILLYRPSDAQGKGPYYFQIIEMWEIHSGGDRMAGKQLHCKEHVLKYWSEPFITGLLWKWHRGSSGEIYFTKVGEPQIEYLFNLNCEPENDYIVNLEYTKFWTGLMSLRLTSHCSGCVVTRQPAKNDIINSHYLVRQQACPKGFNCFFIFTSNFHKLNCSILKYSPHFSTHVQYMRCDIVVFILLIFLPMYNTCGKIIPDEDLKPQAQNKPEPKQITHQENFIQRRLVYHSVSLRDIWSSFVVLLLYSRLKIESFASSKMELSEKFYPSEQNHQDHYRTPRLIAKSLSHFSVSLSLARILLPSNHLSFLFSSLLKGLFLNQPSLLTCFSPFLSIFSSLLFFWVVFYSIEPTT
ncbi:hypothetical protein VP01_1349g1 [Puccinia sorghi]|uniref:Uncharacterized protein n=1 Tax=Puccinia sorghi TaxID=27349 RepID=A0A0L6VM86_9BASI|nr:hypothetical protein VP01_1349g1 [Puccinia sorghi]